MSLAPSGNNPQAGIPSDHEGSIRWVTSGSDRPTPCWESLPIMALPYGASLTCWLTMPTFWVKVKPSYISQLSPACHVRPRVILLLTFMMYSTVQLCTVPLLLITALFVTVSAYIQKAREINNNNPCIKFNWDQINLRPPLRFNPPSCHAIQRKFHLSMYDIHT